MNLTKSCKLSLKGFIEQLEDCPDEAEEILECYLNYQFGQSTGKSKYFYTKIKNNKEEALKIIEELINNK